LPTRADGEQVQYIDYPVMCTLSVGIIGWVLPHVAIIDCLGLNDWVVARIPMQRPTGLTATMPLLFQKYDRDQDGVVTPSEFRQQLGTIPPEQAEGAVDLLLRTYDFNADKVIMPHEVVEYAVLMQERHMAHDRLAPPEYMDGFRRNVVFDGRRIEVTPRDPPLTAADIINHESAWRAKLAR
jgi:hypothetical protein